MRKLLFIIMFVLAAGIAAQAGNVTKQAAARKATAFLNLKSESQLQLLDCGYETMYLFAIQIIPSCIARFPHSIPTLAYIAIGCSLFRHSPPSLVPSTSRFAPR